MTHLLFMLQCRNIHYNSFYTFKECGSGLSLTRLIYGYHNCSYVVQHMLVGVCEYFNSGGTFSRGLFEFLGAGVVVRADRVRKTN